MKMTISRLDWLLIIPLAVSALMIAEIDPPRSAFIAITQWQQAAVLVPITLAIGVMIAIGAAVDRRSSEDYLFQIMSNAALVGLASTMLIYALWSVGVRAFDLPDLTAENMVGVSTFACVTSYYWFRLRGIAQ